ncbi:hypothetical protein EJK15_05325 [Nonomuraea basaltis]|nr:hypothetical protein EJK15_05325 [Nonomuraea basaltis]
MNSPTEAAKRSIRALYDEACAQADRILAKRGHSHIGDTDCPGTTLLAWVESGMLIDDRAAVPDPSPDDERLV